MARPCVIFQPGLNTLSLQQIHEKHGAQFLAVNNRPVVEHYGNPLAEYTAIRRTAALIDLSGRGRLCLLGADRRSFLNGQVTNDVAGLRDGEGCYAALVNAKARIQSDLNIYCLPDEILLDFEPGFDPAVSARLNQFIIADDVQVVDVATHYGLLNLEGPQAANALLATLPPEALPAAPYRIVRHQDLECGDIYIACHLRTGLPGFDCFVPNPGLAAFWARLETATHQVGGLACGWQALEWLRVESGIPRFGIDMDERNLAPETGIADRAINYRKGCYIGQEVIARIRTYGQVTRALRGLQFDGTVAAPPTAGDKLLQADRDVGYLTSVIRSPNLERHIALGYVRREVNQPGTELVVQTSAGNRHTVSIVPLPFV
jgi:folate-binding protein YgfZ